MRRMSALLWSALCVCSTAVAAQTSNAPATGATPTDAAAAHVDDDASPSAEDAAANAAGAEAPADDAQTPGDAADDVQAYTEEELALMRELGGEVEDADPPPKPLNPDDVELEGEVVSASGNNAATTILGSRKARKRIAGSAHALDEEDLEKLEYDDIHRILKGVPGVYLREEDGFGLRPNIGLRGASADRSSKLTLLEDGVLFGPAPYAAPAAYYFPLSTRMVGVEVFKGPASVQNGPHTVGGALNLKTRRIPSHGAVGGIDFAGGTYASGKGHAYVGYGGDYAGILIEGLHLTNGGFKRVDGTPATGLFQNGTGFNRTDVMIKGRVNTAPSTTSMHLLEVKLGYGHEDSNETYLGLTDDDFRKTPWRRYAASANDRMTWDRTAAQLRYRFFVGEAFDVDVVAYRHDFFRTWTKFNGFTDGTDVRAVLQNPHVGAYGVKYGLMTGGLDSIDEQDGIQIGTNARQYVSQGLQARARVGFDVVGIHQDITFGARIHNDYVVRDQTEVTHLMQGGRLVVAAGAQRTDVVQNRGEAAALALFVQDEISWGPLLLAPGLRLEFIETRMHDFLQVPSEVQPWWVDLADDAIPTAFQFAWMPGLGGYWQILDDDLVDVGVLGGVYKGFSPVAPGQSGTTQPEESLNGELGMRVGSKRWGARGEAIAFVNHYSNLTATCTNSSGCVGQDNDTQFQAGAVDVVGVELTAHEELQFPYALSVAFDAGYTFTYSRFATSFTSSNPQWGAVKEGDELPYVPMHQANLNVTGGAGPVSVTLGTTYVSAMRDTAGQGAIEDGDGTDAALLVDVMATYRFAEDLALYMRADNVTHQANIVSRRPFGARPSKPLHFMLGVKAGF